MILGCLELNSGNPAAIPRQPTSRNNMKQPTVKIPLTMLVSWQYSDMSIWFLITPSVLCLCLIWKPSTFHYFPTFMFIGRYSFPAGLDYWKVYPWIFSNIGDKGRTNPHGGLKHLIFGVAENEAPAIGMPFADSELGRDLQNCDKLQCKNWYHYSYTGVSECWVNIAVKIR